MRNIPPTLTAMLLTTIIFTISFMFCGPANAATATPEEVCNSVAANWESKTSLYTFDKVISATNNYHIYYCVIRVVEHRVEYSAPRNLKITYNSESIGYSVRKF